MKNTVTLESFNLAINPRNVAANADNERIIAKLAAAGCTDENVKEFTSLPEYQTLKGHVLRKFASYYFKGRKPENTAAAKPEKPQDVKPEKPQDDVPECPLPYSFMNKFNAIHYVNDKQPETKPETAAAVTLSRALSDFIATQAAAVDEETVKRIVADYVNAAIKSIKPSQIEVKIADNVRPVKGSSHYMLQDVLTDLVNGENVYLYGPAGTGKTVLAKQAAEALGVPFYFTSKIDEVFQLTGFMDANSHYNETELYRCMHTGGVFLFDEMDASAPEALTAFNALLANGIMDFPTGKLTKPENMYIIAAGNTNGRGGTAEYNTRQPIDEATLDRFVIEKVDYDPAIEKALGESFEDKKLGSDAVNVVRTIRKFAERNGLEIIASYRTITRLGKLAQAKGVYKAVVSCIQNKMSEDDYISLQAYGEMRKLQEKGNVFAAAICQ